MTIPDLVTVATAVALVILTAAYAWQTRLLVIEMRAAREEAVLPALRLMPEVLGVNFPIARIMNVGPGHATDIAGRLSIQVQGEERWSYDWRLPILVPGGYRDFVPRLSDSEQQPTIQAFVAESRVFRINIEYADAVGRRFQVEGTADWSLVTEHMWGAGMLRGEDTMHNIEKHAERIAKSLGDATSSIDGVRVTTYRERELRAAEWRREMEERREASAEDKGSPE
jgi:hypothetical protein